MKTTSLRAFVSEHKQVKAAKLLGVTQGHISATLRSDRTVLVTRHKGKFEAYEVKRFGVREPQELHRAAQRIADCVAEAIA